VGKFGALAVILLLGVGGGATALLVVAGLRAGGEVRLWRATPAAASATSG